MKLATITCQNLPQGIAEDKPLFDALKQLNINNEVHAWDAQVNWSSFDACLLRSVWDYHQRTAAFNTWLNKTVNDTTIINSVDVVHWNQNKKYLAELSDCGIAVAPTIWLNRQNSIDLKDVLSQKPPNEFFLKPVIGADSSGTLRFKNDQAGINRAQIHVDDLIDIQDMMLQPYLNSVETFGETSLIFIAGNFTHAVRKIPVKGDYRVQDTFGAQDISYQPNDTEMSLAMKCSEYLSNKFGTLIYARFDFLHHDDQVFLNEAELIEPSLFFHHAPQSALKMALAIKNIQL